MDKYHIFLFSIWLAPEVKVFKLVFFFFNKLFPHLPALLNTWKHLKTWLSTSKCLFGEQHFSFQKYWPHSEIFCGFPLRRVQHYIRKEITALWDMWAACHVTCHIFTFPLLLSWGSKHNWRIGLCQDSICCKHSRENRFMETECKTVCFFPTPFLTFACLSKGTLKSKSYTQSSLAFQLLLDTACLCSLWKNGRM